MVPITFEGECRLNWARQCLHLLYKEVRIGCCRKSTWKKQDKCKKQASSFPHPPELISKTKTGPGIDILVQSRWKQVGWTPSFHIWLPSTAAWSLLICLTSVSSPHLRWQLGNRRHNPFINSNCNVMGVAEKWVCRSGVCKQWCATFYF